MKLAGSVVIAASLAACGFTPDGGWGPLAVVRNETGPDALTTGFVTVESQCVFVRSGNLRTMLLWPVERTAWNGSNAEITFTRANGDRLSLRDGVRVSFGGGETDRRGHEWVAEPDAACGDRAWMVSDVLEVAAP